MPATKKVTHTALFMGGLEDYVPGQLAVDMVHRHSPRKSSLVPLRGKHMTCRNLPSRAFNWDNQNSNSLSHSCLLALINAVDAAC